MKKLIKLSLIALLIGGFTNHVEAQNSTKQSAPQKATQTKTPVKPKPQKKCNSLLATAISLISKADQCQETGDGILNQLEKVALAEKQGDCKKALKLLKAAQNGLNAKVNKAKRDYLKAITDGSRDKCAIIAYKNLSYAANLLVQYEKCLSSRCRGDKK